MNRGGRVEREYGLGRMRTDLLVLWPYDERVQKVVIELKLVYGSVSRTIRRGAEDSAYPANPDSEYGWEKLFSERLYRAFHRNYGMDVRIARFHNIYGPEGSWTGGREKAPAAMCRKAAEVEDGGLFEIWGDGKQTRSFCYIAS